MTGLLPDREPPVDFRWAALVPELLVADLEASLSFWCGLLGFTVAYARPEERFAYLDSAAAQIMLEERGQGIQWVTGELEPPFGRGINFQVEVAACEPILRRLEAAGWPLFRGVKEVWYRAGTGEVGQRQFLVQDPDGYLVRLQQPLGRKPAGEGGPQ